MIKSVEPLVRKLLKENEHLRDSDEKLLANVLWMRFEPQMRYKLTEKELDGSKRLLECIANGDLPHFESIRRVRQKLQETTPALRGRLWEKRHEKAKEVKQEVMEW